MTNNITSSVKVSVVIPVYNSELWVERSLNSVLNQGYENIEVVVVDDGSTDRTKDVINEVRHRDKRIVFLSNESNIGVPGTLNKGISAATGHYISRMDADDVCLKGWLEDQVEYMEANPSCGVVGGWMNRIRSKGSPRLKKYPENSEDLKLLLFFECCFSHSTVMMRKSVLDQLPYIYNTDFKSAQDYELWSRLVSLCDFYCLQRPAIDRYEYDSSVSKSAKRNGMREARVAKILEGLLKSYGVCTSDQIELHKNIALNKKRAEISPSDLYRHLEDIFSLFPGAKNKDEVRNNILSAFRRNPAFFLKNILFVMRGGGY